MELSNCLKDTALNLVTDNVGVVDDGVDRAIIMGDSVKCGAAPVIISTSKRVRTDDRFASRYGTSICSDLHSTCASERARYTRACCVLRSISSSDRSTTRDAVTYAAPAPVNVSCVTCESVCCAHLSVNRPNHRDRHVQGTCDLVALLMTARARCAQKKIRTWNGFQ